MFWKLHSKNQKFVFLGGITRGVLSFFLRGSQGGRSYFLSGFRWGQVTFCDFRLTFSKGISWSRGVHKVGFWEARQTLGLLVQFHYYIRYVGTWTGTRVSVHLWISKNKGSLCCCSLVKTNTTQCDIGSCSFLGFWWAEWRCDPGLRTCRRLIGLFVVSMIS